MADISVQDLIRQEAQKAGVPPELALAVAEQESSFNPTAIGPKLGTGESAIGTFQLLPSTAKRLGVDPSNPVQNIQGGTRYLRELLDRHQGDLQKVLAEYGGVKTDQSYVPSVMSRIGKFTGGPPAPEDARARALLSMTGQVGLDPTLARETSRRTLGLAGLDPFTEQGRRNIAGGVGAALATAVAPEYTLPAWIARAVSTAIPLAGAYFGGAAEKAGEQVAAGGPPSLTSMQEAGRQQMGYEAGGQAGGALFKGVARRVMASGVSKKISQGLSDALDAVNSRLSMQRPPVSPAQAGRLTDVAIQGPSKAVKDALGEAVGTAAESGPALPAAPLRARLQELAASVHPTPAPETPPWIKAGAKPLLTGPHAGKPQIDPGALALIQQSPEHPLPATLDQVQQILGDQNTISFADAHKIKVLMDAAVNWDRAAKKPSEQITKGFRTTLRDLMAAHEPYNQATAAYAPVAKLFKDVKADQLHAHIESNPGEVVSKINWRNPASVKLVKDITALPTEEAGARQGEAAFNAVRAAWTNEKLIAKGAEGMANEIDKIEASNAGREFVTEMFGDPAGQTQWRNLKQIGQALRDAQDRAKTFGQSSLGRTAEQSSAVRDLAYTVLPGHPITKIGAMTRIVLGKGTSGSQMLQWASATPARTQFLIKHVLSGPDPGMAIADFTRWWEGAGENPDRPMPSHEQGPPVPTALAR